jgi:dolichyl-phosphate beta-glucosyltransferase
VDFIIGRIRNLSLIIPAYNEQSRIITTLYRAFNFCKNNFYNWEILVIDDGSTEPLEITIKKLFNVPYTSVDKHIKILRYEKNMGKGFAVTYGVKHAKYSWILFSDSDLSTPLSDFYKLEMYHMKYDIIIGSRKSHNSNVIKSQGSFRVMLGNLFPFIVNNILDLDYQDTQCGFKLMRKDAVVPIFKKLIIRRFAFDAELLYLAKKFNLRVKEVGVHWKNDTRSKVKLFSDVPEMFWSLIKIRLEHG